MLPGEDHFSREIQRINKLNRQLTGGISGHILKILADHQRLLDSPSIALAQSLSKQQRPLEGSSAALARSFTEQQKIWEGAAGAMAKMLHDANEVRKLFGNGIAEHVKSVQSVNAIIGKFQADAFSSFYDTYRHSGLQAVLDIQAKMPKMAEAVSENFPTIRFTEEGIFVNGEEVDQVDLEKISQLDFSNIDDSFRRIWEGLPWTIQALLLVLLQIALNYLPAVVQLRPNIPSLDRQQIIGAVQDAITDPPKYFGPGAAPVRSEAEPKEAADPRRGQLGSRVKIYSRSYNSLPPDCFVLNSSPISDEVVSDAVATIDDSDSEIEDEPKKETEEDYGD